MKSLTTTHLIKSFELVDNLNLTILFELDLRISLLFCPKRGSKDFFLVGGSDILLSTGI